MDRLREEHKAQRKLRREQIIFTLHAGLELVVDIYDEFAELLPQLVAVCEKAIESKAAT